MSFTLRYDGMRFDVPEGDTADKKSNADKSRDSSQAVQQFGRRFSNIGALVMRFQLGQKNRAALIQEVVLQNYQQNPITEPVPKTIEKKELFSTKPDASEATQTTTVLGEHAHATLGKGKVWNERRQPLFDTNAMGTGEALLWDVIHNVVWSVGKNFATQLNDQGFRYIAPPPDVDSKEYEAIKKALENKEFTIEDGSVRVLGKVLPMVAPTKLEIEFDTKQGFLIPGDNAQEFRYIAPPPDDDPKKHKAIKEALENKNFTIEDGSVRVLGEVLPLEDSNQMKIIFIPDEKNRPKQDGFIISGEKGQGFRCVAPPLANDNPEKHKAIREALEKKNFKIEDGSVRVSLENKNIKNKDGSPVLEEILPIVDPTKGKIIFVPKKTEQTDTRFLISSKDKSFSDRPLGWMINEKKQEVVAQDLLEDSIRVIKVGLTRFHTLTSAEQKLLTGGRLTQTGETRVTQNALFNGLYTICEEFNKEYAFNPEPLLGNQLELAAKSLKKHLEDPQKLDDFLTGIILDEMTRPLHVSLPTSERPEIPPSFRDAFDSTANNARALAYAFDFRDSRNREIFIKDSANPISDDKEKKLIDVHVHGKLAIPALSAGRHAGAILSTAILVGEQMFIEQLLREALKNNKVEELLKQVMGDSKEIAVIANKLQEMAATFQKDQNGDPIMGLQYPYCAKMVDYLRQVLKFDELIKLANHLEQSGMMTDEAAKTYDIIDWTGPSGPDWEGALIPGVEAPLTNLYRLGEIIQQNKGTSGLTDDSKGINAGLVPLIIKLSPELGEKLNLSLEEGVFRVPDYTLKAVPITESSPAPMNWIERIKGMMWKRS